MITPAVQTAGLIKIGACLSLCFRRELDGQLKKRSDRPLVMGLTKRQTWISWSLFLIYWLILIFLIPKINFLLRVQEASCTQWLSVIDVIWHYKFLHSQSDVSHFSKSWSSSALLLYCVGTVAVGAVDEEQCTALFCTVLVMPGSSPAVSWSLPEKELYQKLLF